MGALGSGQGAPYSHRPWIDALLKRSALPLTCLFLLSASACISPDPENRARWADEPRWHGHVNYPIGFRRTDSDLARADEQFAFGVIDVDLQPPGFPVSIVLQLLSSYSEDVPDSVTSVNADDTLLTQFNLGLRKIWGNGPWRPFLGAGASFVDLTISDQDRYYYGSRELEGDSDFGLWYGAGVYYEPQPGFTLGLTVQQVVDAEVSLAGQELDAGSFDVLLLLGFSW